MATKAKATALSYEGQYGDIVSEGKNPFRKITAITRFESAVQWYWLLEDKLKFKRKN